MNEDRNPTRRKFLRNSAIAVGSAAIAPGLLSGAPFAEAPRWSGEIFFTSPTTCGATVFRPPGVITGQISYITFRSRIPSGLMTPFGAMSRSGWQRPGWTWWLSMLVMPSNMPLILKFRSKMPGHLPGWGRNWPDFAALDLSRLKLNFSAAHDQWLHDYSRMVSTPVYYKVCAEVIRRYST